MTTKKAVLTTGVSMFAAIVLLATPTHAANQADLINSGDGFNFDHSTSTRTNVQVDNTNVSNVMQDINARVETGGNDASRNIGSGNILTGNATVGVGLQVAGNHNDTQIAGINGGTDVNFVDAVNTGDDASLNSRTDRSTDVNVSNDNSSSVSQMGDIRTMTGRNDAGRNVGSGWIDTGAADVAVGLNTNTNNNMTAIGMGGLSSQNGAGLNANSIVNTGDELSGNSDSATRTRVSSNSYNSMNSYQGVSSELMSGDNASDRGVGRSTITSGNSRYAIGSTVQGNHNMTTLGGLMNGLWSMFY
ncbi:hypothetical protein BH09PAT1_BH09PAT1_1620 [soil metagenome]